MGLDEDAGDADRDRRPRQNGDEFALSARGLSLPARLLDRMGGVEDDRRARLARQDRQRPHVGDERIVAEARAALGHQDVAAPAASSLATTFFMSQGARNCPFLTLTARPVSAAATRRSVCRQRKAGICNASTASATGAHWPLSCTSVMTGRPSVSRISAKMAAQP